MLLDTLSGYSISIFDIRYSIDYPTPTFYSTSYTLGVDFGNLIGAIRIICRPKTASRGGSGLTGSRNMAKTW